MRDKVLRWAGRVSSELLLMGCLFELLLFFDVDDEGTRALLLLLLFEEVTTRAPEVGGRLDFLAADDVGGRAA